MIALWRHLWKMLSSKLLYWCPCIFQWLFCSFFQSRKISHFYAEIGAVFKSSFLAFYFSRMLNTSQSLSFQTHCISSYICRSWLHHFAMPETRRSGIMRESFRCWRLFMQGKHAAYWQMPSRYVHEFEYGEFFMELMRSLSTSHNKIRLST